MTIVEYLVTMWKSLLSLTTYFEMQDTKDLETYHWELQQTDRRSSEMEQKKRLTWKLMVDRGMVAKRHL